MEPFRRAARSFYWLERARRMSAAIRLEREAAHMDRWQTLLELFAVPTLTAAGVPGEFQAPITGAILDAERIAGATGADRKARVMEIAQREIGLVAQHPAATLARVSSAIDTLIGLIKQVQARHG